MSETAGQPQELETAVSAASAPPESPAADNPASSPGKVAWVISLLVSAVLAVTALNFTPAFFELPAEFASVDPSSPPEQQEAASQAYLKKEWKNALSTYAIVGICLALPCVVASRRYAVGGAIGASVASLVFGLLSGLLAVSLGTIIAQQMRAAGYDLESMVPDILAWGIMSATLALPAALSLVIGGEKAI